MDVSTPGNRFLPAPPDPSGAIVTAVGYESARAQPGDHRGLPSPFLTFIVTFDEPVVLAERQTERRLEVVLAGLHTEVETVRMPRRQSGLQAAVHPLAARRLFGVPAAELAHSSFEGEEVLGRASDRLRERLAESRGWTERFAIFAAETRRLTSSPALAEPRPEVVEAWRLLWASRGRIRIEQLAERVFLSRRRLSTLFSQELGRSPKEVARTMRFSHAIAQIGEGVRNGRLDLAATAAQCGYADQSHLAREFSCFAGTSPSGWIAEEFPNIQAGGHRYATEWEA